MINPGRKGRKYPNTIETLNSLVSYWPETGHMETIGPYHNTPTPTRDGFPQMKVPEFGKVKRGSRKARYYRADYLAWYIITGEWPDGWFEHANGMRMDIRIWNLILVKPDGTRWWYGPQKPGWQPHLVEVEADENGPVTHRVSWAGIIRVMPIVSMEHRTVQWISIDTELGDD